MSNYLLFCMCLYLLVLQKVSSVDWNGPLKNETSEYGTVRHYCEYPLRENGQTFSFKVLVGSSFDTLDCFHCECSMDGLHCTGVGVKGWTLSGPQECTVVADGCNPIFVLKSNRKIDCFTRKPVGQLPNGEKGYTVLGQRSKNIRQKIPNLRNIDPVLPPLGLTRSSAYRAGTSAFRSATIPRQTSYQDISARKPFIASRLTRKWPVGVSSAYRQAQVSSFPSRFQTADRKISETETMITGMQDGTQDATNSIAAMIARNSANYQIDKSLNLPSNLPSEKQLPELPSSLIMSRDTLIPNYDFRKPWKMVV